jgi:hypothetical protein
VSDPDPYEPIDGRLLAAGGPGVRRLVKLDLPPLSDVRGLPRSQVLNPANGRAIAVPAEIAGGGLRLWHEAARHLGLRPGDEAWVSDPGQA